MTAVVGTPAAVSIDGVRVSWRLSPRGRYAACTLTDATGQARLEVREVATGDRRLVHVDDLSAHSQLVPGDDGSVIICHHTRGEHPVDRVDSEGRADRITVSRAASASVVPVPGGHLLVEGHVVGRDGEPTTTFTPLSALSLDHCDTVEPADRPDNHVEGRVIGVVALDTNGTRLAVNTIRNGQPCQAIELDLSTGASRPLLSVRPNAEDQIVDVVPSANLVVASTTAWGNARVGYGRPGEQPVSFPPTPGDAPARHLATSPDGSRLAVAVDRGATTAVRLVDTRTGHWTQLHLPPLVVIGRGWMDEASLVVPVSTPDRPGTLLHVDLGTADHRLEDGALDGAVTVSVREYAGADGPIECVVAGNPTTAPTVVVALHGGPLDGWRTQHDPLLSGLAAAGIAVVAPNVRGSTGYGRDHALAIVGRWGGPDLADVLAVSADLRERRGPNQPLPIVLGHSYGAWLALLAAADRPHDWSACIAVSPFVSGQRVVAHGGPVAELVRRLGGTDSRDARGAAASISAPVLLIHGGLDTVVPVDESELVAASLAGTAELVRLPRTGHDVFTATGALVALERIAAFCHQTSRPPSGRDTTATDVVAPALTTLGRR